MIPRPDDRAAPVGSDAQVLASLRMAWEVHDPPPPELVEEVMFRLWLENLDSEVEMLVHTEELAAAGARAADTGAEPAARTMTFGTDDVTMMITISQRPGGTLRVDGWISPARAGEVLVRHNVGRTDSVPVDDDGRFSLEELRAGMLQLVYRTDDRPALATPPISL